MQKQNAKPEVKEKKKKWEKANRYKRKLKQASKLIRIRTGEFIPPKILDDIFQRDKFTCQYCGAKRDLSIDHKVPISMGGKSTKKNMCIACCSCNSIKSNLTVKEFKEKYKEYLKVRIERNKNPQLLI